MIRMPYLNLTKGKVQKNLMLDHFAALIIEFSRHFPRIAYNIMLSSITNLATALVLEKESEGITRLRYPTMARGMSGASEASALAIFPSCVPVTTSIQALPELVVFTTDGERFVDEAIVAHDGSQIPADWNTIRDALG
ncbi:longiborneol synthase [Moniliophthora roreri]|nr:longiborneol synthase [Moniliophthora roreri]